MIRTVIIETIPPQQMRYRTVGDWYFDEIVPLRCEDVNRIYCAQTLGVLRIVIADTGNWRYNLLIAIHELIEVFLCTDKEITSKQVDKFDFSHESDEDPGSHPKAPYQAQHLIAMGVEMMLAAVLGVKWRVYEAAIEKAWSKTPRRKKK